MPADPIPFDFSLIGAAEIPVRQYAAEERIFLEGDEGQGMFLVLTGRVAIQAAGMVLENVGPGGLFGEMALIDGGQRSATAFALEPVELAEIGEADFLSLVRRDPRFALQVMQLLAGRLRRLNESL